MLWFLHMPSISQMGSMVSKRRRKKNLVSSSSIQKHVFKIVELWGGGKCSGFPPCFQTCLQKKLSALAGWYMRGVRGGKSNWARSSTMVWSLSCYPNTNKQRGTLELMIEEGGGGVSGAGWALESPGALKSEEPHTSSPSSGRDSHAAAVSPPNFASFHIFSQLVTSLQKSETSDLAAWLHESFMDLDLGKLLATLYWSSSPL